MQSAGPMIPICDDQEKHGARACPAYARAAAGQAGVIPLTWPMRNGQVLEPLLPPARAGGRGRPAVWPPRRVIVNAILYLDRTGCAWRYLPAGLPALAHRLRVLRRLARRRHLGRGCMTQLRDARPGPPPGANATPTAAVIDSQSVRAADTVPKASRGWDNAKKVNGRKRHIAVDTAGPAPGRRGHRRQPSRTATAPGRCCGTCARAFRRRHAWPGPTAATPGSWSPGPPPPCS